MTELADGAAVRHGLSQQPRGRSRDMMTFADEAAARHGLPRVQRSRASTWR